MATKPSGAGDATQGTAGDPAAQTAAAHPGATGTDPAGQAAGSGAAAKAKPAKGEGPKVSPAAADVLGKYPAVEEVAGASICEVEKDDGTKERVVLARMYDGEVQLTPEGQWIWDKEFGPNKKE